MDRLCDTCGMPLTPQTGRGGRRKRHPECSVRAAGRRGVSGGVGAVLVRPGSVRDAVEAELDGLGAWDRPESLAAVTLADLIDSRAEQGAAHAALVREFRATMAELRTAAKSSGPSIFDELAKRRAENERASG